MPMILRPKSVGSVKLKSKNPLDKPLLEAGYFTHPDDIKVLVEGKWLEIDLLHAKPNSDTNTIHHYFGWFQGNFPPKIVTINSEEKENEIPKVY